MVYSDFNNEKLSRLGFGTMRLPLKPDKSIDEVKTQEMVDYCMEHGVNYFDTAFPYHEGKSEIVIGKALSKYPRDSYNLASKYPGHQIATSYDPAAIFEEQLKKCNVEYFDFYLLHNVYENSIKVYTDSRWGIVDYFLEQKKQGRIRHLGFSSHGGIENMKDFLALYGDKMEFCQIQLNYLDWTLQDAKGKYELLSEHNIPVWVMEPVRGGKLSSLSEENEHKLKALRPSESIASWCFRWLMMLPDVKLVLSGMSDMEQMVDNVRTFSEGEPLSEKENDFLLELAEGMKKSVPCTACRYCCDGCPMGLDIPMLLATYNDTRFSPSTTVRMRVEALSEDKQPSSCIGCGACAAICPQKIDIPTELSRFDKLLSNIPSWVEMCRRRDEAAAKNRLG